MQREEKLGLRDEFALPFGAVDFHALLELFAREIHPRPVELLVARHPADLCFARAGPAVRAVDDPFEHPEKRFSRHMPGNFNCLKPEKYFMLMDVASKNLLAPTVII